MDMVASTDMRYWQASLLLITESMEIEAQRFSISMLFAR